MITQPELKEALHYDPTNGRFTWLRRKNTQSKVGKVAGSVHRSGYIYIKIDDENYPAHNLAWLYMTGENCSLEIDHINGNPNDNRIDNLRHVPKKENLKNKKKYANNTTGITGVYWEKHSLRWSAKISIDGSLKSLGRFDDKFEAICARKSAENGLGFHKSHGKPRKPRVMYGLFLNTYDYYEWHDLVAVSDIESLLVRRCEERKLNLLSGESALRASEQDRTHFVIEEVEMV